VTNAATASPVKISIVIPVYNEFRSLPQVLERVISAPLPAGCYAEIIIVDDGSTDGTTGLLKQRYSNSAVMVVHHSVVNLGKGAAVRIGIAKATGSIVLIQDGDLEYDPKDYPAILQPLVDGSADVVYGSRFLANPKGMKFLNWTANKILTFMSNALYGARITDEGTAYKAFRVEVLRSIKLKCMHFEFCPEVTAKVRRTGYRIMEVPIFYNARGVEDGKKIRWHDGVEALWTLIKYRFVPLAHFDASGTAKSNTPEQAMKAAQGR